MKLIIFLLLTILINSPESVFSQSGRTVAAPTPIANVLPHEKSAKETATCENAQDELIELSHLLLEKYVSELNRLGKCGYRMESVTRFLINPDGNFRTIELGGVVLRDAGSKYEYNWFVARTPGEAQDLANKQATNGFYFRRKFSFVEGRCSSENQPQTQKDKDSGISGNILNEWSGSQGAIFLFERKIGSLKKNEYKIIDGRLTGEKGELEANIKTLNDYAAKGFRPVDLWYIGFTNKHLVLMEKDDAIKPDGEYFMLSAYHSLNSKLDDLGKIGYKPLFVGLAFALLHRVSDKPLNLKFYSMEDWDEMEKNITKFKQTGVTYLTSGISDFSYSCDPKDDDWLFAVSTQDNEENAVKKDFVFLHRNSFFDEFIKKNNLKPTKKNPVTKAQIQEIGKLFNDEMNRLLKQGYKLTNYGSPHSVVVLFEHSSKQKVSKL